MVFFSFSLPRWYYYSEVNFLLALLIDFCHDLLPRSAAQCGVPYQAPHPGMPTLCITYTASWHTYTKKKRKKRNELSLLRTHKREGKSQRRRRGAGTPKTATDLKAP